MGEGAVGKNFYNDLAVAYGYEEEARTMTLCGPEGYVRERVEASREAGVTMLGVTPVGPEPARLIETVKNWL